MISRKNSAVIPDSQPSREVLSKSGEELGVNNGMTSTNLNDVYQLEPRGKHDGVKAGKFSICVFDYNASDRVLSIK